MSTGVGQKRSAKKAELDADDYVEIKPLGAGSEVGRSCISLSYKGKKVLLDCGIHPAHQGIEMLPYFDEVDLSEYDALLVSHFHLDHAAAIPYLVSKTNFKGRIFMTHATTAIFQLLLADFVRLSSMGADDVLYDDADLAATMDRIESIDYHQEFQVNGIRISSYNAGHVLGAAMFLIDIAGVRILYTGDYSRGEDRHLMGAETPPYRPNILIVESTYGVQTHLPRRERESRFTGYVHNIIARGGRCLIPTFALGRAQELLLILDEHWKAHKELQHAKIYYASSLAARSMTVYQTYVNMMNENIREAISINNPFNFQFVEYLPGIASFQDNGPSVVMASPGMLQSGLSRELFERWCGNKANGLVLPGYCVEGTLASQVTTEPSEITTSTGLSVPLNLSVHSISFSAHSDFAQTSEFVDTVQPPNIVLVHGQSTEMARLKTALKDKFENRNLAIFTPKNCQAIQLYFRPEKHAKTIGSLASAPPEPGQVLSGLIVKKDFAYHVMASDDLTNYTRLNVNKISQSLELPFSQPLAVVKFFVTQLFADTKEIIPGRTLQIYDSVWISQGGSYHVHQAAVAEAMAQDPDRDEYDMEYDLPPVESTELTVEWEANATNDMVTDALIACVLRIESNPSSIRVLAQKDADAATAQRTRDTATRVLTSHYGPEAIVWSKDGALCTVKGPDATTADIAWASRSVSSDNQELAANIKRILARIDGSIAPLAPSAASASSLALAKEMAPPPPPEDLEADAVVKEETQTMEQ